MTSPAGHRVLVPLIALIAGAVLLRPAAADEPVFSGPQPGEKLVPFQMKGVLGDAAGKPIDLVDQAAGKPILIVFFHQRTRPAFALTNALMRYAADEKRELVAGTCMLTDDATETEQWMNRIPKYFTSGVAWGISPDGQEGPGAYGLNRSVTLTVLVGKDGKVTDNFALIQPSVQADGPKILKAVVEVLGGGEVPDIAALARGRMATDNARQMQPELRGLLREVINQDATPEQVDRAAAAVEDYLARNAAARGEVGAIAQRIIRAGRLENYGTPKAQQYLRKWAEKYGVRD